MAVVKFNDRSLFPSFFDDFNFDDFFTFSKGQMRTVPATNIEENDDAFVLNMAIPGMDKNDINVEVENGTLLISAEKEDTVEEKEKNYRRTEYSYDSFERRFTLPENVTGEVAARYKDGVLFITLPKMEVVVSKAKKIEVA